MLQQVRNFTNSSAVQWCEAIFTSHKNKAKYCNCIMNPKVFKMKPFHSSHLVHKCIFGTEAQSDQSVSEYWGDLETDAIGAPCLIASLLLFSVKGKERKGIFTNKFSSIHWLHLVRQGLLLCVPRRHSASQLPRLDTHTRTRVHAQVHLYSERILNALK